ncbi:hypothetical protein RB195_023927 [Necator americanus]|uniref:Endonuclease/exonuclease/phosphatase domain-containing protein n=1 Tax=Necator americanus TaxID=51031 RepID=A0ABR1EL45_NECAM
MAKSIDSFEQLTIRIGRLRMRRCGPTPALNIFVVYAPTSSYEEGEVETLRRSSTKKIMPFTRFVVTREKPYHSKPKTISAAKERRGVKVLGIILGCFTVCWAPFFVEANEEHLKEGRALVFAKATKHTAKAHNLKDQLPEGSMESLATTICFVTLNCRTLSSELQQAALSRLLRYLCVSFAALQETRMRDRPVISIENYTIYCGDADEIKVGGCAIAVRNDYKNLVEEFGSTSSRCAFLRLRDRGGRKLWIVSAHAPTETAEDNSKNAFYDELNALMSKIPSQQVVIVGIDANAKMGLEQQSDVLGKWYYAAERTSDDGDRLVDLCEQTGLIIASTFKRNHRRHQLTWQGSTLLTPEEQRKRKMRTLKLQLDCVLARRCVRL